jgi:hypothetical protein
MSLFSDPWRRIRRPSACSGSARATGPVRGPSAIQRRGNACSWGPPAQRRTQPGQEVRDVEDRSVQEDDRVISGQGPHTARARPGDATTCRRRAARSAPPRAGCGVPPRAWSTRPR